MNARACFVLFAMFGVASLLGAGFALLGPVALVRIFGAIALVGGAVGCALQLYALRAFAPQAHVLLQRKVRGRFRQVMVAVPVLEPAGSAR